MESFYFVYFISFFALLAKVNDRLAVWSQVGVGGGRLEVGRLAKVNDRLAVWSQGWFRVGWVGGRLLAKVNDRLAVWSHRFLN